MKSAEKPFVRIFSTLSITMGLDWLGYNDGGVSRDMINVAWISEKILLSAIRQK